MTFANVDETQRRAATVVGVAYLLALAPAIFAEFYVPLQLFGANAGETARNILEHQQLFRLGIASNLAVFALDVVLITALYVALNPVSQSLALLAAFLRLIETAVLVFVPLNDMALVRVLSDPAYAAPFGADRLPAMTRLSFAAHGDIYSVGLLFAGAGSALFCCLWYRSRYVPRTLAAWGIVASLLMGARAFATVISPGVGKIVTVAYYGGPIFFFELTMGCWLLVRGLRPSGDD